MVDFYHRQNYDSLECNKVSRAVVLNPGPQVPPVLHVLDVSLLQHTWWMGRYLVMQKPANDHSFESGVLEQGNI